MNTIKSRLVSLIGACILIGAVACVDSPTAPQSAGRKAVRDSIAYGDTLLCRSGWEITTGRIVCRDET
jgi:hypothetical protein